MKENFIKKLGIKKIVNFKKINEEWEDEKNRESVIIEELICDKEGNIVGAILYHIKSEYENFFNDQWRLYSVIQLFLIADTSQILGSLYNEYHNDISEDLKEMDEIESLLGDYYFENFVLPEQDAAYNDSVYNYEIFFGDYNSSSWQKEILSIDKENGGKIIKVLKKYI